MYNKDLAKAILSDLQGAFPDSKGLADIEGALPEFSSLKEKDWLLVVDALEKQGLITGSFYRGGYKQVLKGVANIELTRAGLQASFPNIQETERELPVAFISKSFDKQDEQINIYFESILSALNVRFITAKKYAGIPIEEKVRSCISNSDVLIGIYVVRYQDSKTQTKHTTEWLIREVGIAQGEGKGVIALVEKGISDVGGLKSTMELISFEQGNLQAMQVATIGFLQALKWHHLI